MNTSIIITVINRKIMSFNYRKEIKILKVQVRDTQRPSKQVKLQKEQGCACAEGAPVGWLIGGMPNTKDRSKKDRPYKFSFIL